MRRTISRLIPLALAVVAALVLTGLGVYAARMEREIARRNVSGAADAATRRLSRAIDTLAAEFATGLPAPGEPVTQRAILDTVRHLYPLRVLDPSGCALGTTTPPPGAILTSAADDSPAARYVRDALDAADRLGDDAAGREAQSLFLRAAADAAPDPLAQVALRVVADAAEGLLFADEVVPNAAPQPAPGLPGAEGLELLASGAVLRNPDRLLGHAMRLAPRADGDRISAVSRPWFQARQAAAAVAAAGVPVVRLAESPDGLTMIVAAPITLSTDEGPVPALLLGDVPTQTLRSRVVDESESLVRERNVRRIALSGPSGLSAVEAITPGWDPMADATSTILRTSLAPQFRDWSIEAVAVQDAALGGVGDLTLLASIVAGVALLVAVVALLRAADRQARLAAERQTFLDHVAHEVRTPAGALLALSEELAAGRVPAARHPKYHDHLANESRRLARLVEDTLDLSRLDAGKLVLDLAPHDLRAIVAEGIEAAAATDRVAFRAPTEPVIVRADAAALRRVVRNLVDNAIRHGGAEPKPEVTVSSDAKTARVTVRDHGPGIAPDDLPRLFERFRRKPSATHETKGVGVGLAISREIARTQGGDVTAANAGATGAGAVFVLTIPVAEGTNA
ncbi:MAG: HAMP domain-containing histidine kinase [Planctomycetes bacterium]|nr:HAMP domain-containing histidine kinase [Planctomycetota bacterium]